MIEYFSLYDFYSVQKCLLQYTKENIVLILCYLEKDVCMTCFVFLHLQFIEVGTMVSPTVYAKRTLAYLLCDQPDAALHDAM